MLKLDTIRYMGNKSPLLENILKAIKDVTRPNGVVLDIMAGSNSVSYALKEYFTIYTNDIQEYSYVISKAVIENQKESISKATAEKDLSENISINKEKKYKTFFEKTYSFTYFSKNQCIDIDSIIYAINKVDNVYKKSLYLVALMCASCKVQSTPGHFAQFMPSTHKRIEPLQKMSLLDEFYQKCENYKSLHFNENKNKSFCMEFKELLKEKDLNDVDTIYLDSPYSQEQYSRFYHILETIVKDDNPQVMFKAKYREDRFKSDFCYKNKAEQEFKYIFKYCKDNKKNLVISYSNKGVVPIENLYNLSKDYFATVELKEINYTHSTLGKGANKIKEIIIKCVNNKGV